VIGLKHPATNIARDSKEQRVFLARAGRHDLPGENDSFSTFDILSIIVSVVYVKEITHILEAVDRGEPGAAEDLLPLVYEELRRLAGHKMASERAGHTLQATALVHEAWLRLAGEEKTNWAGRAQFFSAAAEAMRRILVERARKHLSLKRGSGAERESLEDLNIAAELPSDELLAVHESLERLALEDRSAAELVKLRYFAGLSMSESAVALGVSQRSLERIWTFAKAWLRKEIVTARSR
jgi:RNA polymerase sigma factor (TIGR02999 family)